MQHAYSSLEQARVAMHMHSKKAMLLQSNAKEGSATGTTVTSKLLILNAPDHTSRPYLQKLAIESRPAVELDTCSRQVYGD